MKKIANYLIALAVAAFTFTSCEDVPSPFGTVVQPDSGEEVVIEPQGSGTKSDPYNVAAALEFVSGLGADVPSDKEIYVKGFVTGIKEQFSAQYGNAQFTMSDTKEGANTFTFFRGLYLGNKKWVEGDLLLAEGDEVIVCGKVVNYKGNTPETVQNAAYTYSINGKTEGGGADTPTSDLGTKDAPITVAKALEAISKLADSGETSVEAYVKGKISKVQSYSSQYKSITYYISDDGKEANQLQIYSGKNIGGAEFASKDDLAAGDEVVVKGKLKKYVKDGTATPEMNQPNEIITITKGSGGGGDTPTSDLGTKDAPITVAKALETISSLADGGETEEAYVKGIISKVQSYNSKYKSITYYISDDGKEANELQVYSGKGLNGADFAAKEDLAAGDVVVIKGKLKKYVKDGTVTPEINQSSEIISLTKGSGGDTPSGSTGLEQSFEAGKGDFTIEDKSIGEGITYVWYEDTKNKYMKASAYKGGCIAAESWLISPAFSLKGISAPVMTFNNACNQVKGGNITDHIKVMVYDGANWTEASISGMPDGKSWTFVDSTVDLKSVAGKTGVKVAFKYVSTAAFAPTWEIKNVSIK